MVVQEEMSEGHQNKYDSSSWDHEHLYEILFTTMSEQASLPQHKAAESEGAAESQNSLQTSLRPVVSWKRSVTYFRVGWFPVQLQVYL